MTNEDQDIEIDDTWFGAEGEYEGFPTLIRGRQNLTAISGHPAYNKRLTITWFYSPDNKSGMPSANIIEDMEYFENKIFEALEKDPNTIFVVVFTHNGLRKWIGYSRNLEETSELINEALYEEQVFPIELSATDDPNWDEYWDILRGVGLAK